MSARFIRILESLSFRCGGVYQLSNYYSALVEYNNKVYNNNEAAFHAQKDISRADEFTGLIPRDAKRLGRSVKLREDWEEVKYNEMFNIVYAKFSQNEDLAKKLKETGSAYLEETNTWKDKYWGVYNGIGENNLGKILMSVRDLI